MDWRAVDPIHAPIIACISITHLNFKTYQFLQMTIEKERRNKEILNDLVYI